MRNLLFPFIALIGLAVSCANAQVVTQIVTPGALTSKIKANHRPTATVSKRIALSPAELNGLLDEDGKQVSLGFPFRFGKAFDVDLGLTQGVWTEIEEGRVWQLQINAPKANHLNFQFDKFRLAKGAELIFYNADQSVQMGPITAETNNGYNTFATDIIRGETITIELFEPRGLPESSVLHLSKVIYGYKNIQPQYAGNSFGQAQPCSININCSAGSAYQTVANSVAMVILADGTRICSSTMLNNNCLNFRPYMLTAFHCMDRGTGTCGSDFGNGQLSQAEINMTQNWVFRFKYRSPGCSPTTEPSVYYSYSGCTFRSANAYTDFALVELNQMPSAASGVAYAGWTRSTMPPLATAVIAHPSGDVMKIATISNAPTLNTTQISFANPCGGPFSLVLLQNIG